MASNRLSECRELEYILIGDLRDLLEEPPNSETRQWMAAVLDALLDTIPEEFSLKSDDGYLREVLDEFPNWADRVTRLEEEYFSLYRRLYQLRRRLQREGDYIDVAYEISTELKDWMEAFRSYIQSEQHLVLLAANLEVGGDG
jgi:hypothetical protein